MKFLITAIVGLLFALMLFLGNSKVNNNNFGSQLIYKYQSEGIGYSDIGSIYSTDSNMVKQAFFNREKLQTFKIDIQCEIRKTMLGLVSDGASYCFQIVNPSIQFENSTIPINTEHIKAEITKPVFVEISTAGNVLIVITDSTISYSSSGILKEIISNTQFVRPDNTSSKWQVIEENGSGSFIAKYQQIKKDSSGIYFEKNIKGFIDMDVAQKGQRLFAESFSTIYNDSLGRLKKMNKSESQITLFNQDTIIASGNKVSIDLISIKNISGPEFSSLKNLKYSSSYSKRSTLSTSLTTDEINRLTYISTLENDNYESLMKKLNATKALYENTEDELVKKFRALAYLFPESCERMGEVLKSEPFDSDKYKIISQALAITGNTASINALAKVIKLRKNEYNVLIDLLPVLSITKSPTDEAVKIVKELAFENNENEVIVSTAQLALGGMANNLRNIDKEKSEKLTGYIIDKMANVPDKMQKALVLGNTGSPNVFPVLKSYIDDITLPTQIRATSISVLRLNLHEDVTGFLQNMLSSKDSLLTAAAKDVIEFRNRH